VGDQPVTPTNSTSAADQLAREAGLEDFAEENEAVWNAFVRQCGGRGVTSELVPLVQAGWTFDVSLGSGQDTGYSIDREDKTITLWGYKNGEMQTGTQLAAALMAAAKQASGAGSVPGAPAKAADPQAIPVKTVDELLSEGLATKTSDGKYVLVHDVGDGQTVDFLLEKYEPVAEEYQSMEDEDGSAPKGPPVYRIVMARGGLQRRSVEDVHHVGLDEKSFGRGHSYVSLMTDLDGARVLDVVEDRTREAADSLWNTLPTAQREQVRGVAMDMWDPYIASTREHAPGAEIVHDKFHVSKHLNEAVDQVRRQENKRLRAMGDDRLVGSKQLWLFHPKNLAGRRKKALKALKEEALKTSRAWAIKEHFRRFWRYVYSSSAAVFFDDWYSWAVRSRLRPMVAKAKMLKGHLHALLSYFRQQITNAISEGFNSRIQSIKSAARGFRAFENYRTRILFYCGKLDLLPERISH
jgi:hypothetical protein